MVLRLPDLVENGTVSAAGADLLRGIGHRLEPFIVYSRPRNAGKSTVTEAVLAEAPAGTSRHDFLGTEEEIVRAFDLAEHGYALATSLHADTVDELAEVLVGNGVATATIAANVRHLVKVQPLGDPFAPDTRRIVEAIDEVAGVQPDGRLRTERRYG